MATRILVVEDNEDSRLILLLMLKHFGYEAIGAATGTLGSSFLTDVTTHE